MAFDFTGDPTAAESPSASPGAGVAPILRIPEDADAFDIAALEQPLKTLANNDAWQNQQVSAALAGMFGDGSDGAFTFDGSTTPSWATRSGSVYTLSRDVFPTNWTFNVGTSLKMRGYRVFGNGTLDTSATSGGGVLNADGAAASGSTSGLGGSSGTVLSGSTGGTGATDGAASSTGVNQANSFGGAGGAGGNTSSVGGGNAGGTVTAPTAALGRPQSFSPSTAGHVIGISGGASAITALTGGAGGGGGIGAVGAFGGSELSGGGGAGGGIGVVLFRKMILASAADIRCAGGAGGNGVVGTGTGAAGGGGGGGGLLFLGYASSNKTFSAATNCPGGAAGTGTGTGKAGVAGSTGTLVLLSLG